MNNKKGKREKGRFHGEKRPQGINVTSRCNLSPSDFEKKKLRPFLKRFKWSESWIPKFLFIHFTLMHKL